MAEKKTKTTTTASEEKQNPNRTHPVLVDQISKIALNRLGDVMNDLERLAKMPPQFPNNPYKEFLFRANAENKLWGQVKILSQLASGAMHKTGSNSAAEKDLARLTTEEVKKRINERLKKWEARRNELEGDNEEE